MKRIIPYAYILILFLFTNIAKANDAEGSGHDIGISVGPNFALTDLVVLKKLDHHLLET